MGFAWYLLSEIGTRPIQPVDPFLKQKLLFHNPEFLFIPPGNLYFTQFILCLSHPVTVLHEILGGRMHGPSHLKFWETVLLVPSESPPVG